MTRCERRQEPRFRLASVTVAAGLVQPVYQRKVHAVAELKNDVTCSGFTEVLIRSDNEPAILVLTESTATALKLAGVTVKMEESALYDSQGDVLAESAVKDVKEACGRMWLAWSDGSDGSSREDIQSCLGL